MKTTDDSTMNEKLTILKRMVQERRGCRKPKTLAHLQFRSNSFQPCFRRLLWRCIW